MGVIQPSFEDIMGGLQPLGKLHIQLNGEAQERATSTLHALIYTNPQENLNAVTDANGSLASLATDYWTESKNSADNQKSLVGVLTGKLTDTDGKLNSIYSSLGTSTELLHDKKYSSVMDRLTDSNSDETRDANETLGEYINKNTTDVTVQNYLNNINIFQNLAQQRYSNAINTNQINAGLVQQ
ncbi:MAG: hypothetical protein II857_02285 [Selenomonadaceae bacterium]|nr:hypothetical protein [Selenomonadaceae bacterium]